MSKAGKVRQQTPKIPKIERKRRAPRVDNKRKYRVLKQKELHAREERFRKRKERRW